MKQLINNFRRFFNIHKIIHKRCEDCKYHSAYGNECFYYDDIDVLDVICYKFKPKEAAE